jgi:hypothetical protein
MKSPHPFTNKNIRMVKKMIVWRVEVLNKKTGEWIEIGTHKFNFYDKSRCMKDIEENRPDLMAKIYGNSWDVRIKVWR